MPEIAITDKQRERLQEVRGDVQETFVDTYGHVRLEDALQYLLDTYTPPEENETAEGYDRIAAAEYPELQRIASEVPDAPGSGISADEMRGRLLSELGPEEFATKLEAAASEESTDSESKTSDEERGEDVSDEGEVDADEEEEPSGPSDSTPGQGGGGVLASANQLLREHDDKWREGSGDAPYEVDLPDGTTEAVRTKDDVRQHLFRHY